MSRRYQLSAIVLFSVLATPVPIAAQLPSATSTVEVLDLGTEPRRLLRYTWTLDHEERLRTVVTVAIQGSEAGVPVVDMELPVSMTVNARVTEVNANDTAWVAMTFDDLAFGPITTSGGALPEGGVAPDPFDEAMALVTPLLDQTRVWQLLAANGRVLTTNVQFPDGFPLEVRQQVMQSSSSVALLPLEPVGVGARWQTTGTTETQGVSLAVTSTMELVAMDGDDITLAMSVRMADEIDTILPAAIPFDQLSVEGVGTYRLDLGGVFPRDAIASMTMTMAGDMPGDMGGTTPVVMQIVVDMDLAARDRE